MKIFYALLAFATAMVAQTSMASGKAVELTFNRTGTSYSSVTVNASGVDGITASLVSASHSFRGTSGNTTSSIICPNVNGNTYPIITLEFSITGIPEDYNINSIDFDIHALNGSDGYQESNDNKKRLYNLNAQINGNTFGSLTEFDIASNVNPSESMRHKIWTIIPDTPVEAGSPITLILTISAGSRNEGCFFGLSSITLNISDGTPAPGPDPGTDPDGKYYLIKWKANTTDYMQQSGNKLVAGEYSVANACFWQFIPTGNANCYYIRNIATGQYIGSCNRTPSSSSTITVSNVPVEYYVGQTSGTATEIRGCVWLSSTDCSGYNTENGARALNKDGASSDIITWQNGTSRPGSYWTLIETENLYEIRPFVPASAIGQATDFYYIQNSTGKVLSTSLAWSERARDDNQRWYFEGESAAAGGYQIVAGATDTPAFDGKRYIVDNGATSGYYTLSDAQGNKLSVDGISEFAFSTYRMRSKFALDAQIYTLPCGSLGNYYVTNAVISTAEHTHDLYYPMGVKSGSTINYPSATRPSSRYTMLSRDYAVVNNEPFNVSITLNAEPASGTRVFVYFDWNRDGDFEYTKELTPSRTMQTQISVPEETAIEGISRMRIRITDNNLIDADDDINGQVLDLFVNYVMTDETMYDPTVTVNAPNRGTASYDTDTHIAKATAAGTATFLYWAEKHRVHSLTAECEVAPAAVPRNLVAIFSPNLDETVGTDNINLSVSDASATIQAEGRLINVISDTGVRHILVFSLDGAIVSHACNTDNFSADNLSAGVYIVKAITETGSATAKIILN